jgi:putative DeoR family transcriptional regulator (stage III sporulation protein D)
MRKNIEDRVLKHAEMFLKRDTNVRSVSEKSGWSRQTVFKDLTDRLQELNLPLYEKIQKKMARNKYLGQLKGGITTQEKYLGKKQIYKKEGKQ